MLLISGGVYCLMQWCRDTSEVKLSCIYSVASSTLCASGSIMLRR